MSLRFPFDLVGRSALIELIRRDRPSDHLSDEYVLFEDLYFTPSEEEPGRTYIEMTNLKTGKKRPFLYRRLDINVVLREYTPVDEPYVRLELDGDITTAKIVDEINRKFNMHLNYDDVEVSYQPLTKRLNTVYTLIIRPGSFAYYGYVPIYVNTTPEELGLRLLEDGTVRLLENGTPRRLETQ
ncbi:hypothetical protein D3C86_838160 [compost metagenome]